MSHVPNTLIVASLSYTGTDPRTDTGTYDTTMIMFVDDVRLRGRFPKDKLHAINNHNFAYIHHPSDFGFSFNIFDINATEEGAIEDPFLDEANVQNDREIRPSALLVLLAARKKQFTLVVERWTETVGSEKLESNWAYDVYTYNRATITSYDIGGITPGGRPMTSIEGEALRMSLSTTAIDIGAV
jgi:hypothetical protein